mgnify:CR=1 FL=1
MCLSTHTDEGEEFGGYAGLILSSFPYTFFFALEKNRGLEKKNPWVFRGFVLCMSE